MAVRRRAQKKHRIPHKGRVLALVVPPYFDHSAPRCKMQADGQSSYDLVTEMSGTAYWPKGGSTVQL
ncbi:hypothetical protein [Paenibacillus agaridevorans]|uniref:hypothetical protein n=1 Tax=Paenibacillus agaridevorans TaxID=171404 RepID=UPI001BE488DD|nr:hypothetical protein [Paenibacillus agaridevorans]